LHEYGRSLEGLERISEAEAKYCEALALARQYELRPVRWRSHAALARVYQIQNLAHEANIELQEARVLVEALARSLPEPDIRMGFIASPMVESVFAPRRSAVEM
jgi:hypothetical protein